MLPRKSPMISHRLSKKHSQRVEIIPNANSPSSSPINYSSNAAQKKKTFCVHNRYAAKGLEHLADEPDCLANNRVDDFNRPKRVVLLPYRKLSKT
jgi:hypothetical protein